MFKGLDLDLRWNVLVYMWETLKNSCQGPSRIRIPEGRGLAVTNSLGSRFQPPAKNLLKQEQLQLPDANFRDESTHMPAQT